MVRKAWIICCWFYGVEFCKRCCISCWSKGFCKIKNCIIIAGFKFGFVEVEGRFEREVLLPHEWELDDGCWALEDEDVDRFWADEVFGRGSDCEKICGGITLFTSSAILQSLNTEVIAE